MSDYVQLLPAMTDENLEQNPADRLLTVAEFAQAIGKTERQVYRYIKNQRLHTLTPEETGQAGVRISGAELERFQLAGGSFRVRSVSGVGSAFESFADSVEGMAEESAAGDEESEAEMPEARITVPLERHEAAVMRLGYLQSQYEQSQRLLTEGSQRTDALRQQVSDLQAELQGMKEKVRQADALEQELAALRQQVSNLQQLCESQKNSLDEADGQIMRFKVKAEVESDTRAEAESKLRTLSLQLNEARQRAEAPWYKRLF